MLLTMEIASVEMNINKIIWIIIHSQYSNDYRGWRISGLFWHYPYYYTRLSCDYWAKRIQRLRYIIYYYSKFSDNDRSRRVSKLLAIDKRLCAHTTFHAAKFLHQLQHFVCLF